MDRNQAQETVTRRDLLTGASAAALFLAAGAEELRADEAAAPAGPPIDCAVIGLGKQGKEILASVSRVQGANVVAVCDTYAPFLTRAKDAAPKATGYADFKAVLDQKNIGAVFIATPTHQHKEIVLAALQAGKHVYCEAPLAHTVEDARAIAQAGKDAKLTFAVGQQNRANPQHLHVNKFLRGGVLGHPASARAQWHKKTSWRFAGPTDARDRELNWRLSRATSAGLMGEIGIHSLDTMNWFMKELPVAVSGFGGIMQWEDGRDVPDTVQCVVEYPNRVRFSYDATLANSFDASYELLLGADAAVLLRGERAWLFKEADAPLLGWEVYARKEPIGDENGIALVADATKLLALGKIPGKDGSSLDPGKNPLFYSVESFLNAARAQKPAACGPEEGFHATVTALKANEAVLTGTKIAFQKDWFDLR